MVDHEERQATTSIAKVGGTFQYTARDQYKEMRGRYVLTSALFVATQEHYSKEIKQNEKKIELLRKTVYDGMRELNVCKSNMLKPHEHLIMQDSNSIKNLRDKFVVWAARYTELPAEATVGIIKSHHVRKLISEFDYLLHGRQKLVNQIEELRTAMKAATSNDTLDRMERETAQKMRVLNSNFAKMKDKLLAARDVNSKYKQIAETLTEQCRKYPVLIETLEKELARLERVNKNDFSFYSQQAEKYLQDALKKKRHLERKTEISCEAHRRILLERKKRLWKVKKQMGESKEIGRLIQQAGEIGAGGFVNEAAEYRWNLAISQERDAEELVDLQMKADQMKPTFNILRENCAEKMKLQTKRMQELRHLYESAYKNVQHKRKVLGELRNVAWETNWSFQSMHKKKETETNERKRQIKDVEDVCERYARKVSTLQSQVQIITEEMACLCDKFNYWSEVQRAICGRHRPSFNFTNLTKLPQTPKDIGQEEILEHLLGFLKTYFQLIDDAQYNIEKFYPIYEESDEQRQVNMCKLVLNQSRSDRTITYLSDVVRSRYSRLKTDGPRDIVNDSIEEETAGTHNDEDDDMFGNRASTAQEYKNRIQMKKCAQNLIVLKKSHRNKARNAYGL